MKKFKEYTWKNTVRHFLRGDREIYKKLWGLGYTKCISPRSLDRGEYVYFCVIAKNGNVYNYGWGITYDDLHRHTVK